ncbi:AAA family ATPase [Streptococcus suis]|uniref:AAA family ATPase n=1 Tax=Streptococcus suis TaxID=1307 RepID=UPI00209BAF14|nr:AAA family ATPase [Streptococcus suis]MCO8188332.1 AAA family ATPase [Streptococcus suis]MCO8204210.1 AAA family ATPase [Streptococcus suis]MCO8204942.1 AAA family ATPase [Streptococcus suis]MCO8212597.1 AAA family ATPase [Streptococcus suis]MCO8229770.1 AAA family ATPase [Streptococcus suis]
MEKINKLFYKRLNESDFKKIYGMDKPTNGGGQTYIEAAGLELDELYKFLEFGEKSDPSNRSLETRLTYEINVYTLGDTTVKSITFQPRTNRKNYKINQQNLGNTHPAWTPSNNFPEPVKDANGDYDSTSYDWNDFKGITIFIISTDYNKYYAGFFSGEEFPASWGIAPEYNHFISSNKIGIISLEHKNFKFVNSLDNPFGERVTIPLDERFPCNERREEIIQEIHFGAPGTGKSYSISKIISNSYSGYSEEDDNPFVLRTTIHSEYSYYDFIGSVMPVSENNSIKYKFQPGIFTKALANALKYQENDVFLIIEEMSRGNIAAIFGDTFQLLDRKQDGNSEYQIDNAIISDYLIEFGVKSRGNDKIYIPSNLHIIGTVNTSDQNVNVIDTAFKRRFNFEYKSVEPARDESKKLLNSFNFNIGSESFEWNCFYTALNNFIVDKLELSDDKQIGQFFVKVNSGSNAFSIIKNKVLHYLWDDVQEASLKNIKLFNESVKSFTQLFDIFTETAKFEDIFSQLFIETYNETKTVFESNSAQVIQESIQTSSDSESISTSEASSENSN